MMSNIEMEYLRDINDELVRELEAHKRFQRDVKRLRKFIRNGDGDESTLAPNEDGDWIFIDDLNEALAKLEREVDL